MTENDSLLLGKKRLILLGDHVFLYRLTADKMLVYDLFHLVCGTFHISCFQSSLIIVYVNDGLQITGSDTSCLVNDNVCQILLCCDALKLIRGLLRSGSNTTAALSYNNLHISASYAFFAL